MDLLQGIYDACKTYNFKDAVLLSAIGSLKHVNVFNCVPTSFENEEIHYGFSDKPREWGDLQGVQEMCSVKGTIHTDEDGEPAGNLYVTFSNAAGTVLGGKLAPGTLVKLTSEVIIGKIV